MAKRAVLYARVSGDDRDNDGRNLASQIEMGREYARKAGYTVVAELAEDDRGASGAEFDLPMLAQALNMARNSEFDVLIVRELDRFARKLTKQLVVEEEFKRAGVMVEYVLGEYPDTPEGRLNKHIRATIAEWEREKITERMTRGRRNAVQQGGVLVADRPPYGYQVERRENGLYQLVVVEEEARIVRQIYQWYTVGDGLTGPLSIRAIARRLTADAVPARGGSGQKRALITWRASTVGRVLASTTYSGTWFYGKCSRIDGQRRNHPKKDWIPVDVPAIVDQATWDAAQERRRENIDRARRNTKRQYLLRRRLTCGGCGLKLSAFTDGKGNSYYVCHAGSHHDSEYAQTCNMPAFRCDQVDFTIWAWLKDLLANPESLARKVEACRAEQELQLRPLRARLVILDDLLTENRQQLGKLLDLYLSGDFDKTMLVERKTALEKTVASLEAESGNLAALLAEQEFSAEQVKTVHELAAAVRADLALADDPEAGFPIRARIVDRLNVTAILKVEDGVKVAYVACRIDDARLLIASHATKSPRRQERKEAEPTTALSGNPYTCPQRDIVLRCSQHIRARRKR